MNRTIIAVGGTTAVALLALTGGAAPSSADSGPRHRHIEMQDDCDPTTFNQALGEGTCVGDGDTTFDELLESFAEGDPDGHWRNKPEKTHVRKGGHLVISNTGGEFHTFTEVEEFGPGCVPEINELLGLEGPPAAADCGAAFSDPRTALPPGGTGTLHTHDMSTGTHHFMCVIHPWMHTTVEVRRR
jgi:hypothetical protein